MLKQGSDSVLYMDPVKLLQNTIATGAKLRAENEVRKGIYNIISEVTKKGFEYINGLQMSIEDIGYILKDGEKVKPGYVEMSYNEGGKKIRFAMKNAAYQSLFAHPREMVPAGDKLKLITKPLRWSGSALKVFATGVGAPFFFVANVFYDFAQQVMFTDTYNGMATNPVPFLGLGAKFGMAFTDWAAVLWDAGTNGPLSQEYKMLGGSLEFLTRYGLMDYSSDLAIDEVALTKRAREIMSDPENTLNEERAREKAAREQMSKLYGDDAPYVNPNTVKVYRNAIKNFFAKMNSTSEMTGRLANTRRWIKKYTQEYKEKNDGQEPTGEDLIAIKKRAVANAVDYANFNNGGRTIKFLDSLGFAYLNAAAQVFDKSVRYVSENPKQFLWDTAQWASVFGLGLMAYNLQHFDILDEDEEKRLQDALDKAVASGNRELEKKIREKLYKNRRYYINHISPYDRENYHCIILPGKVTDIVSQEKEVALQEQLKIAESMQIGEERDARIAEIKNQLSDNRIVTPRYLKIPSDARLNVFRLPLEELAFKHITGSDYFIQSKDFSSYTPWGRGDEKNSYGRILQKAIPAGGGNPRDLVSTNPLLNVSLKVLFNYDAFYNRPVWNDYNEAANGYTQYEGDYDKYEDRWLRDLSKRFDKMGLREGGFGVTTMKSAIGSMLTNMDRSPWNAVVNHSYVAATGGLNEYEKEEYGNQMNVFLNDAFGPVTKRYIGEIDLLRKQKTQLQAEADHIRETEERFQANLNLAYKAASEKFSLRKDPNSGAMVDVDGKKLRFSNDARDDYYFLMQDVIAETHRQIEGRLGNDPVIDQKLWNRDQVDLRIAKKIMMDWNFGEYESDIQQAIMDFKQGKKMTSAFIIYEAQKEALGNTTRYETIEKLFTEEGILTDPQIQYMMTVWAREDDKKTQ